MLVFGVFVNYYLVAKIISPYSKIKNLSRKKTSPPTKHISRRNKIYVLLFCGDLLYNLANFIYAVS